MDAMPSPQPLAVGEVFHNNIENQINHDPKQTYASQLAGQQSVAKFSKIELCPVTFEHGIPTFEFIVNEVNSFTREEGLQQAVIIKFSYGKPELQELRQILPKQFDVKGNCNIGQLEYRHILVRFDLFEDFAHALSKTTGYVKAKGDEFFFRTFLWTLGFNPHEETSKAVTRILFPEVPANFFAKKSLMSIASAVGKPLAVDKATQDRTRPSTARVKVLINLLDKHPKKIKIKIVDMKSGKIVEYDQQIMFDNLPKYCTCCNHQGHDVKSCRWSTQEFNKEHVHVDEPEGRGSLAKLGGDAREYLDANLAGRRIEGVLPNVIDDAGQTNFSCSIVQAAAALSMPNVDVAQLCKGPTTDPLHVPMNVLTVVDRPLQDKFIEQQHLLQNNRNQKSAWFGQGNGTNLEASGTLKASTDPTVVSVEPVEKSTLPNLLHASKYLDNKDVMN